MTPGDFVASFETVAEAPGGIKRLREMVLDLAMRGQLVRSDPSDETASALIARLGKAALGRESGSRSEVPGSEQPYGVRDTWRWCRFVDVATIESCLVDPSKFLDMPHVAPDNIEKATGKLLPYCTIRQDGVISSKHRFYPGQILYSKIRPNLSKVVVVDFEGLCSADMYPIGAKIDMRFLHLFMLSPEFLKQVIREDNRLAMPKVNQQQLSETIVAVPPLAEQKRIVAKVDQLMALCTDLEARQAKKRETAARLNRASLDALTTAEGPEEVRAAWTRISDSFDVLFDGRETISGLRQMLRRIAVRGQLVGDPSAKHAVALAGRPWWTPSHWRWARADELCHFITKGTTPGATDMSDGRGEIPFLKVYNLTFGNSVDFTVKPTFVSERVHERELARSHVIPGDVLMNIVGPPLGKVSLVPSAYPKWNINQAIARFRPNAEIVNSFLALCLLDVAVLMSFDDADVKGTAGQDNISLAQCRALLIPVPPLAEQLRIVAKVDQLMAVCDRLEAAIVRAESTAQKLAEAVVAEIVA